MMCYTVYHATVQLIARGRRVAHIVNVKKGGTALCLVVCA